MILKIFMELLSTPEKLKEFLTSYNLSTPPICCDTSCNLQLYRKGKSQITYRCNKCTKKRGIFTSETFKNMKISLQVLCRRLPVRRECSNRERD